MAQKTFDPNMTVADAAKSGPEARKVIEKYFGKDCFSCPSFSVEPLFMGARMHGQDIDEIIAELEKQG